MTDVRRPLERVPLAAVLFSAIALLIGGDVVSDYLSGVELLHLALEGVAMLISLAGILILGIQMRRGSLAVQALGRDLEAARADAAHWRAEAGELLLGLGAAIDQQFERWGLTPAERDVGLMLLKGLSHKEIAGARATSERTVRQQALALYRKAGLSGRTELAAFFLEDLLLPTTPASPPRRPGASPEQAPDE